jgi:hypothetical protein
MSSRDEEVKQHSSKEESLERKKKESARRSANLNLHDMSMRQPVSQVSTFSN